MRLFEEKQQLTICAIGAAIVCVFTLFWYMPLRRQMSEIKQARTIHAFLIAKGTADSRELPLKQEQLLELETRLAYYEAKIPDQRAHGLFLQKIADLMKEHDLDDQVVTPGAEIEAGKFNCIPVSMKCKGELTQIYEFYRRLQTLDRLVRIEKVQLSNDDKYGGRVSMETEAVVYYRAKVEQG